MNDATHIDLCIRSDRMNVDYISKKLGLAPTSGFNSGDTYIGKVQIGNEITLVERHRPSFGAWHYSTERLLVSPEPQDHAELLLLHLRDCSEALEELLQSGAYVIQVTVWYVGTGGFDLKACTVAQLAKLCDRMTFVCCDGQSEDESGNAGVN